VAAVSSPGRSRSMIEICFARADWRSRENEKKKEKERDKQTGERGEGKTRRWKRSVKGSLGVSRQIESKTRCFIKAAGSIVVHWPR